MSDLPESAVRRLVREAVERALGPEPAGAGPAPEAARRVAIGADHGGYALKEILKRAIIEESGWTVHDCGTHSTDAVDYPDYAAAVGREVASGRCARGVIVDAAGIGSTMAANKIPGVRCALGARVVNRGLATRLVRLFLGTAFEGGRHQRRVQKIMALERHA